jgi:hypothetical protein
MSQSTAIFWPLIVQVFATLALYAVMSSVRVSAFKAGKATKDTYKYMDNEPEETRNYTRALANQFESPVLFYTGCLVAYVTNTATLIVVALAWGYALAKLVHVYVHATANRLKHRRPAFIVAFGLLVLMWLVIAVNLVMRAFA